MKTLVCTLVVLAALAVSSVPALAQTATPPPANPLTFLPFVSSNTTSNVTGTAVVPSPTSTLPPVTVYIPLM